jgi:hypothetical protein
MNAGENAPYRQGQPRRHRRRRRDGGTVCDGAKVAVEDSSCVKMLGRKSLSGGERREVRFELLRRNRRSTISVPLKTPPGRGRSVARDFGGVVILEEKSGVKVGHQTGERSPEVLIRKARTGCSNELKGEPHLRPRQGKIEPRPLASRIGGSPRALRERDRSDPWQQREESVGRRRAKQPPPARTMPARILRFLIALVSSRGRIAQAHDGVSIDFFLDEAPPHRTR